MGARSVIKGATHLLPWVVLAGVVGMLARDHLAAGRAHEEDAEHDTRHRGRGANSPAKIPLAGWKDIFWRTVREVQADDILGVARGVAFAGLLAVFPALAAFVSIYGLFANPGQARENLSALTGIVPADALTLIGDQMVRIAIANEAGLTATASLGLLLSIWSANAGMTALFKGLNIAFEEVEKRGYIKRTLITLAFTIGMVAFLILSAGAVIAAPTVLAWAHLDGLLPPATVWLRWPALMAVATFGLSLLYRYGPSREHARWRWVSVGAVVAAVAWLGASVGYSFYLSRFAHYETTYGSLGAVFGFMVWLWLSAVVILIGAELNAEIEHQTAKDSTTGAPEPLGERGATMADEIGRPAPTKLTARSVLRFLKRSPKAEREQVAKVEAA